MKFKLTELFELDMTILLLPLLKFWDTKIFEAKYGNDKPNSRIKLTLIILVIRKFFIFDY